MKHLLNQSWKISSEGIEVVSKSCPCSVMSALLENNLIDDPYYRDNEAKVLPYLKKDYKFETTFVLSKEELSKKNYLVLDRVCTIAKIFVNDVLISDVSDMHIRYHFLLDNKILKAENKLTILFSSSYNYIKNHPNEEGLFESYAITEKESPIIRQANYMFGWDWGPLIPDMGIMGESCILSTNNGYLETFRHHYDFKDDGSVIVKVDLEIENTDKSNVSVALSGHGFNVKKPYRDGVFFEISSPKLWNPVGFGEPNLYDLTIDLGEDSYHYQIGIRKIRVDDSFDKYGRNFAIYVNGNKVFLKGSNYIPEDSIIPFTSKERTERLIELAKNFNHNCIRVWGGGYYPNDDFYETCDRLGILVWQDLMFACGSYNIDDSLFKNNVIKETRDALRRIRHHASLFIIAGNNEVEDGVRGHGHKQALQYLEMFHHLLKDIVNQESDFYYLTSSPTSGEPYFASPSDTNFLDTHYWWVWGSDREIEDYLNIKPRLLSEFGLQSLPTYDTICKFTEESDLSLDSKVMISHQKDPAKSNEKMMRYVRREFNFNEKDLKEVTYLSMLTQAEGIKLCVENLRGNKYRCNGAIYWQLNDCWPCQSLSSIDYYFGLKALHYYSKRFYNPHLVLFKKDCICVSNDTSEEQEYQLSYSKIDLEFNLKEEKTISVRVDKYSDVDIINFEDDKNCYGYVAYLKDKNGKLLSSNIYHFLKDKNYKYPTATIKMKQISEYEFEISSDNFARAVYLNAHDYEVVFSDNYFDLLANRPIRIIATKPIKVENIEVMCVNNL